MYPRSRCRGAARALLLAACGNSARREFCSTLAPLEPRAEWDGQYTIFGAVVSGLEVAQNLTPGDRLITVTLEEAG